MGIELMREPVCYAVSLSGVLILCHWPVVFDFSLACEITVEPTSQCERKRVERKYTQRLIPVKWIRSQFCLQYGFWILCDGGHDGKKLHIRNETRPSPYNFLWGCLQGPSSLVTYDIREDLGTSN